MKPIVFISSVFKGYEHIREAAKESVCASGGRPIGFEDYPAQDKSSRNVCLNGVRDCDIYLGIFGGAYGWEAPSGLSATEEEYQEALSLGKRRLIFIEKVKKHDPKQQSFIEKVGDYTVGRFYKHFAAIEELKESITTSLKEIIPMLSMDIPHAQLKDRLTSEVLQPPSQYQPFDESWLITGANPVISTKATDEVTFNKEETARQVFIIGQEGKPPVFEIELGKSKKLETTHWQFEQMAGQDHRQGISFSVVRFYEDACIVVGMNVSGREKNANIFDWGSDFYISPDILKQIALTQIQFIARLYNHFDPHQRWDQIAFMSALHSIRNKNFGKTQPGQHSHTLRMQPIDKPMLAFEDQKIYERNHLQLTDYPKSILAIFERKLK